MIDNLRELQVKLEENARGETIRKFHREHHKHHTKGTYSDTSTGSYLISNYLKSYSEGISEFISSALSGKAGRRSVAAKLLKDIEPEVVAFLFAKAIFNRVPIHARGSYATLTGLAIYGAGLIHDELRIRYFQKHWRSLARKLITDFASRELPRYKRKELIRKQFNNLEIDWAVWSKEEMVLVGTRLAEIFKAVTGDIDFVSVKRGRHHAMIVEPQLSLLDFVEKRVAATEALFTTYPIMVVPPRDWSEKNTNRGGYLTSNLSAYPLVKGSTSDYRNNLKPEDMPHVFKAINALQRTPWRINTKVLDVLLYVFQRDEELAGLPSLNPKEVPQRPNALAPDDFTSELSKQYRRDCYLVHEENRRNTGKRIQAARIFHLANEYKVHERFYMPHDLDSRSRAYPKPALLNPQGPDFAKALLEFADGKPIVNEQDACWLAFHGANSWGFDKGTLQERVDWVVENEDMIIQCACDPKKDLRWTEADSPAQFLSFCFEWHTFIKMGYNMVSHIHVDVDATCSGLQHFSAMLRDEICGHSVNMTPNTTRQDVYQDTASRAEVRINQDMSDTTSELKQAWVDFTLDRSIAKRPVMIVPYKGTFHACMTYVEEAVHKRLKKGEPLPWHGKLSPFITYGSTRLWAAIADTVPSAINAMYWLSAVTKAVAKSAPVEQYIRWTTPVGFPVRQRKFKLGSKRVKTILDGSLWKPRLTVEKDELDPRLMANCVPPSFVHSLDACHMQLTISKAHDEGLQYFAAVHDSFGVHCTDIPQFNRIIREAFVEMYETNDVLEDFWLDNAPYIKSEHHGDIPEKPSMGTLDLTGVLESDYFFS